MSDTRDNLKPFELAPEEILVPLQVTQAGHSYRVRHRLRPPAPVDWYAYEAALQPAVEELADGHPEPSYRLLARTSEAAAELWSRLIRRVEGYSLPGADGHDLEGSAGRLGTMPAASPAEAHQGEGGGGAGGNSQPEWSELIPLAHKEAAVRALTLVAPAQPADDSSNGFFPLTAEEILVVLEAAANGAAYPRLVHRFRPPSVEAERRYRRLLADNLIVRGSRTPRTLLPARLPALVRLYDELILGTEGYALNGQPLASSLQAIRHMDAWHKRVAVEALFGGLTPDTVSAEVSE